jgi:prepilin-type N-terminal cleavage/methylation domain-containing protein
LNQRTAFTLIELLVVIAIIAILAAMLLPALTSAKNRAQMAYDLNNNRQVLISAHMYASDFNDRLPQPGWVNATTQPACWAMGGGYADGTVLAPGNGTGDIATYNWYYPKQVEAFKQGQLGGYLAKVDVLMCPADQKNAAFYKRKIYITSYIWSLVVNNWAGLWGGDAKQTCKVSDFKVDAIIQCEADETTMYSGSPVYFNDFANFPDEGVSPRHGKGATVGFVGGSSSRIPLKTYYSMAGTRSTTLSTGGYGWKSLSASALPNQVWCHPANNGHPNN